jgi:plasmid stabilization system protein ParE
MSLPIFPVIFSDTARADFLEMAEYITAQGFPETAATYGNRLLDFCQNLGVMPEKHPFCSQASYKRYHYRCTVFEKTYVVAYRVDDKKVVVKRIVHGKRLV